MSCGCVGAQISCASRFQAGVAGFAIYVDFLDINCKPIDLHGATMELVIQGPDGPSSVTVVRPVQPWNLALRPNRAVYMVQASDFEAPGTYRIQFRLSFTDGRFITSPIHRITVLPNLEMP